MISLDMSKNGASMQNQDYLTNIANLSVFL
uniref:Uncharacterized protein n=1 Tax=Rhizophora mucronata TaxID=61149 RepID=A0A2P2R2R4_RHIMU